MEQQIAAQYAIPSGRVKAVLQFNKVNGTLTMVLTAVDVSTLNQEYYTYIETEYDFEKDRVVSKKDNTKPATVDDWVVMAIADLPQDIYESQLDSLARDKITKAYPLVQQVNLIGKAILALDSHVVKLGERLDALRAELGDDPNMPPLLLQAVSTELKEMYDYISEVKMGNALRKEYYQESNAHAYISAEEEQARLDAVIEGGIREAYGTEPSQGGRVF